MVGENSHVDPVAKFTSLLSDMNKRIAELERALQRSPLCGFTAVRTANDAAIANNTGLDITWTQINETTWPTLSGAFTAASAITIPSGMGGRYAINAEIWWNVLLTNVYVSITKNNSTSVLQAGYNGGTYDRLVVAGNARFDAGDVIRLRVYNGSGSSLTPNAYGGDLITPPMPFLRFWRIAP